MTNRIRLADLWDHGLAYMRRNNTLLVPVAAAFFFLPSVLLSSFLPQSPAEFSHAPAILALVAILLCQLVGQLAILTLMIGGGRPTVGESLVRAGSRLPAALGVMFFFGALVVAVLIVAQLLVMTIGGGRNATTMMALSLVIASPFLAYLIGRAAMALPVLAGENLSLPHAIRRAFTLSAGHGWQIAGLLLVAMSLYLLVQLVLGMSIGGVFLLLERLIGLAGIGGLLVTLMLSAIAAATNLIITVGTALIYRDLAAQSIRGR